MARQCSVCADPRIAEINAAILEGIGTAQLAEDYGYSRATIESHRHSGHAARSLTRALLSAGDGPLAGLLTIEIANKVTRVSKLQAHADKLERIMEERSRAYGSAPGGSTGLIGIRQKMIGSGPLAQVVDENFFDDALDSAYRATLEQVAKECGEWRPGGTPLSDAPGGTNITVNHITQASPAREGGRTIEHPPQRPAKRLPNPPATPGILQQLSIDGSPEVSEAPSSDSCKSGKLDLGVSKGGVEVAGAARPGPAVDDSEGD